MKKSEIRAIIDSGWEDRRHLQKERRAKQNEITKKWIAAEKNPAKNKKRQSHYLPPSLPKVPPTV